MTYPTTGGSRVGGPQALSHTFAACAVVACVGFPGGIAAQAQPSVPRETIVVQGCLQNNDTTPSAAGSPVVTSGAPSNPGVRTAQRDAEERTPYTLVGARAAEREGPAAGGAAAGIAGTARTRNSDGTVTTDRRDAASDTYALIGGARELAAFEGHLVEVSGTIVPSAETNPPTAAAGGDAAPRADGARSGRPTPDAARIEPGNADRFVPAMKSLRVASIKNLADSCAR